MKLTNKFTLSECRILFCFFLFVFFSLSSNFGVAEIILSEDFEGLTTVMDEALVGSTSSVTTDEAFSGLRSLKMDNSDAGKFSERYPLGASYDVLYVRYMFLVGDHNSACWNSGQHYKNMGFEGGTEDCKGGGYESDGTDCFTVRTRFNYPNLGVHVESAPYPGKFDHLNTNVNVADGQWHCFEMKVTLNTPGTSNGEIRHWVDGIEAVKSNLEFRIVPTLKIDKWWFTYWANDDWCGPLYLDDLVISTEKIGCNIEDEEVPGDVNNDKIVNIFDIIEIIKVYDKHCGDLGFNERADVKEDCIINIFDIIEVIKHF